MLVEQARWACRAMNRIATSLEPSFKSPHGKRFGAPNYDSRLVLVLRTVFCKVKIYIYFLPESRMFHGCVESSRVFRVEY